METIAPGVHQVDKLGPLPSLVHSFVVDGDEGVVLVDAGLPRFDGAIRATLATIGRSLPDVVAIVLTHAHTDHLGGAAALQRDSGAEVWASVVDAPAVEGKAPNPPPPIASRLGYLAALFRLMPDGDPVAVDYRVSEGSDTPLPADFSVIDTPGHTPGHVSYLLDRAGGVLFVGDAAVSTRKGTIARGPMNRAEPTFDASVRHLAEFPFEVACFGHADPVLTGAAGRFQQFATTLS